MACRSGVNVTTTGHVQPERWSDGGERRSSFSALTCQRPTGTQPRAFALRPGVSAGDRGWGNPGVLVPLNLNGGA